MFAYVADNSKGGGAGVGDCTYEQITGWGGGVSQIARGTNWRYFLNWSQMIDFDWHFQNVEF